MNIIGYVIMLSHIRRAIASSVALSDTDFSLLASEKNVLNNFVFCILLTASLLLTQKSFIMIQNDKCDYSWNLLMIDINIEVIF